MADRVSFVAFAKFLGVELTPGQLAFARVAFDSEPVHAAGPLAVDIFGGNFLIDPRTLGTIAYVAGARSGKTYLFALRLLHLAFSVDLSSLAPGEDAFAIVIAPRKEEANQAVKFALGALKKSSLAPALVGKPTDEEFTIARQGKRVVFKSVAASVGGISGRGKSLVGALMDECAFFRDADYQINDQELYNAVGPRIMEGGQLLVGTTPWGEAGLIYELWKENFGKPKEALVAHATTERMRIHGPSWEKIKWQIEQARHRDPENALREFDAEFMSGYAGTFFEPVAIDSCVRPLELVVDPTAGAQVVAAADFGFKHDSSALALFQKVKGKNHLSLLIEKRPEKGKPLKPSEVAKEFAGHMKRYGCRAVMADGWHRESMMEHLGNEGVSLIPAPDGMGGKILTFNRAKERIYEGSVVFPHIERLVLQFKEVVAKPSSGGGISIQSPRWKKGGHGDLMSAVVLGLYQMQGPTFTEKKEESFGEKHRETLIKAEIKAKKEQNRWNRQRSLSQLLN